MNEQVEIAVRLTPTYWEDRFPSARVYINDQLIFDEKIVEEKLVNWKGTVQDRNKISVELHSKRNNDTVTDSSGNIVNDVLLNIVGISIDDIDLGQLLWTKSVYYPDPSNMYAPNRLEQCVNLGWNGRWELEFDSPIYLWLLENF
jgi:hypothetical protein